MATLTAIAKTDDLRWAASHPAPETDPGHLLPDEVWAAVVADVEGRAATRGRALPDRTISAVAHGGLISGGPRMGVIHSAETPLAAGYAYSIARNWFATAAAGTSATVMIDPAETVRLLPDNVVAYHVGAKANGWTVGVEQAGRASFTRAQWLTNVGRAQMRRVAQYMVECRDRWGIPLRWATDAQIRAAAVAGGPRAGWCLHDDVRRVLGGTTHTDPGVPPYPKDELMALAIALGSPTPAPTPAPASPPPPYLTGDDAMIVASVLDPNKPQATTYGVLSGGVLTGLAADGGITESNKAGRLFVLWVTKEDWAELDRKSKLLLGAA